jgi:hypothetical protein
MIKRDDSEPKLIITSHFSLKDEQDKTREIRNLRVAARSKF